MLGLIYDIVGYNDAGQKCHPFKGKQGTKKRLLQLHTP